MPEKIFVCYRRSDSLDITNRICDNLREHFGEEDLFVDERSIPKGVDFREALSNAIEESDLVLVVIGNSWIDAPASSKEEIVDEEDSVRFELEMAIEKQKAILPILVHEAKMPTRKQLPASLESIADLNAECVRSELDSFRSDVSRLRMSIQNRLGLRPVTISSWILPLLIVGCTFAIVFIPLTISLNKMNKPCLLYTSPSPRD